MNISAAEFKGITKRVSTTGAERIVFNFKDGEVGSSDLNVSIITRSAALKADHETLGVNTKLLHDITSKLKKGDVELGFGHNSLLISAAEKEYMVPTVLATAVVIAPPEKKVLFPRAALIDMLEYVAAAADGKQRFNYTGSLQVRAATKATIAAGTDTHRLAVAEAALPLKDEIEFLLPFAALKVMKELAGGELQIAQDDNAIFALTEVTIIKAARTTQTFPGYAQHFTAEPLFVAEVMAAAMREALDTVSPMIANDERGVRLRFSGGKLTLIAGNGAVGEAKDVLAYEQVHPDVLMGELVEFEINLNHAHLRDYFAGVGGKVILKNNDKNAMQFACDGKKLLTAAVKR